MRHVGVALAANFSEHRGLTRHSSVKSRRYYETLI
jgi:hypothetical protein